MIMSAQRAISFLHGNWPQSQDNEPPVLYGFVPPDIEYQLEKTRRFIIQRQMEDFRIYACYSLLSSESPDKGAAFLECLEHAADCGAVIVIPHRDILTDEEYRMAEAAGVRVITASGPKLVYSNPERLN